MKQKWLLFVVLLAGCTERYGVTLDNVTCYGADGKPYFHAITRRVRITAGGISVADAKGNWTYVTGNCIVEPVKELP